MSYITSTELYTEPIEHLSQSAGNYLQLVCVGDAGVGKSSALLKYLKYNRGPPKVPLEIYHKALKGNLEIDLMFWDTAGQPEYDRLRPLAYPQTNVFVIFYSVCEPESLDNIFDRWVPEIQYYCPGVPFILAGCKADARDRLISYRTGLEIAAKNGAHAYTECSVKDGTSVRALFTEAVKAATNPRKRSILKQLEILEIKKDQKDERMGKVRSPSSWRKLIMQGRDAKHRDDPTCATSFKPVGWQYI